MTLAQLSPTLEIQIPSEHHHRLLRVVYSGHSQHRAVAF